MSTSHSIPQFTLSENSIICRYCCLPIEQITSSGGSPGGTDSDYVTFDGNSWCESAGNRLTYAEFTAQPIPTIEQWKSGNHNFSPYQYHEPVRNRTESELVA